MEMKENKKEKIKKTIMIAKTSFLADTKLLYLFARINKMYKVSVILSVYNQEKFLEESFKSILEQSFSGFEFLIIDDASSDRSLSIIKQFAGKDKRIKIIINQKRLGLTKSLNIGLRKAQGEYIARMDGDDIALPDRLEKQIRFLDSRPQTALIGSWAILIDKKGRKLKVKKTPASFREISRLILKENPFIHPTIMFRKKILEDIGLYNENYSYAQDYELILRILKKYKGENIPLPLLLYRVGGLNSISVKKIKQQEKFALKARFNALSKFGYPLKNSFYLIKPLLSFLVPARIKMLIYKRFYWD